MGRRKKEEHEKENAERWLLTYADMITLLMLFFIVLYSMSTIDAKKYAEISDALEAVFSSGNFGIFSMQSGSSGILEGKTSAVIKQTQPEKRASLKDELKKIIQGNRMSVSERSDGIVVTMAADLFFASGSAAISDEGMHAIQNLASYLAPLTESIRVEGHTDSVPLAADVGVADNWELSARRALGVLAMLAAYGVPESRLSALAYGATKPVRSNATPEGRAENRRVEIVILFDTSYGTGENAPGGFPGYPTTGEGENATPKAGSGEAAPAKEGGH